MKRRSLILSLLLPLVSGCAWLAPKYERPVLDLPEQWTPPNSEAAAQDETLKNWWKGYQDPAVEKVIEEALTYNSNLAVAAARIKQAQANYDYTVSNRFPLLGMSGFATRSRLDYAGPINMLSDNPANNSTFSGVLSYEVDLWGKLAGENQEAKAILLAANYNREAVKLLVASAAAQVYFDVLALDADVRIVTEMLHDQEEAHRLVQDQFGHEMINGLVLRQSEAATSGMRAALAQLTEQREKAETSLAMLLGRSPREIVAGAVSRGTGIEALPAPPLTPSDLPSNLLQRRPDIAAAEQLLIASNVDIGVARASYFPTITLAGLLNISSLDIENIYTGSVRTWGLGGALAGPLLDFGRTSSGVDFALAKHQEQVEVYKSAVRNAFKEVKDALSADENGRLEEKAQAEEERALQEALQLADQRVAAAYSSYFEGLKAKRALHEAQISHVAAKLRLLDASVSLYKALGGGWRLSDGATPAETNEAT